LFFFQAEDGIRDPLVTGVQTCALPISGRFLADLLLAARNPLQRRRGRDRRYVPHDGAASAGAERRRRGGTRGCGCHGAYLSPHRSEERRVGKEGRYRWGVAGEYEKVRS